MNQFVLYGFTDELSKYAKVSGPFEAASWATNKLGYGIGKTLRHTVAPIVKGMGKGAWKTGTAALDLASKPVAWGMKKALHNPGKALLIGGVAIPVAHQFVKKTKEYAEGI